MAFAVFWFDERLQTRGIAMKTTLLTLSAIGWLSGALAAQGPAKPALERALAAFRQGDVDQDGALSGREAQALRISDEIVQRFDDDGDANIARDEFLLYYHDLLVQAGQPAGSELESEVGRIQAIRRARDARRQERERAVQVGQQPADERAARARADLRGQDTGASSAPDEPTQPDAAAALIAAFDMLEERIIGGVATREDYEALRAEVRRIEQAWIARARRAARQGDQQAQQNGVEQASAGSALIAAIDDLERRATAGQVVGEAELGQLKNRLIARARQGAGQPDQAGRVPAARAAGARAELSGRAAQQDPLTTDAALSAALDRLEQRVLNGEAKRDEFQALRERFIARARSGSDNADGLDVQASGSSRLVAALDDLEQKFLAGTVARSDFRALREMMIRSAREASSVNAAGDPVAPSVRAQRARTQLAGEQETSAEGVQNAAPKPATRLMNALAQLEERALGGNATPDDYQSLRAIFIQKARQAVNGGDQPDGISAERAREMQRSLDALEAKAGSTRLTAQDFEELRGLLEQSRAVGAAAGGGRAKNAPANARQIDAARGNASGIEPARPARPVQDAPSGAGGGSSGDAARGGASNGSKPPQSGRGGDGGH